MTADIVEPDDPVPSQSVTASRTGMMIVVALLLEKAGGHAQFTQEDFNRASGLHMYEMSDGFHLTLSLTEIPDPGKLQ